MGEVDDDRPVETADDPVSAFFDGRPVVDVLREKGWAPEVLSRDTDGRPEYVWWPPHLQRPRDDR